MSILVTEVDNGGRDDDDHTVLEGILNLNFASIQAFFLSL